LAVPPEIRKDGRKRLDFLGGNLGNLVKANTFKGRQCVLSLPAEPVFVQHVKIAKLPAEDTTAAVRRELQGKLPFALDQAIIRHILAGDIYGDGEPRQEVVTVSTSRDTLDNHLGMARSAKLDVVGVNVECCALVECFGRMFRRAADASRTILYMDIGAASTQVVLSHGSRLVFARNLPIGGDRFDLAVTEGMRVPVEQAREMRRGLSQNTVDGTEEGPGDAIYNFLDKPISSLVEEVTQCLRYYESVFRNQAIERAIFLGGQAYDKRLCQTIARQLNLPAQIGDPLLRTKRVEGAGLQLGLDRREPQPDWAVAVGLSLGQAA
jgi:type IV pilus assembly protein PilM